ncbi:MAG: ABC transporter ATP-binding protein [Anaerolineae bacterium]|nr:ABC transporter ATP-binding protein [Anaerolineae bacterium]
MENNPLLLTTDLNVHYGGIHALRNINIHVAKGEIVSVIGANGAGKSTLLKTISGVKEATSGKVLLDGQPMPRHSYQAVLRGVTLVPEGRRIFAPLSVKDNLMLGAYSRSDAAEIQKQMEMVFNLFPVLHERLSQPGGTLSGGEQQMLAVGRALMSQPRLLLLDEPSLGLAPMVIDTLLDTIVNLNETTGLTILLVEQNASLALEISHHAFVLETGEIRMEGKGSDLLDDPRIKESYLGMTSHQID